MIERDRRKGVDPIPHDLSEVLTPQQLAALPSLEEKGIVLFAVRRPLFQEVVVIVKIVFRDSYGVLLEDGTVDYLPDIVVRESSGLEEGRVWSVR